LLDLFILDFAEEEVFLDVGEVLVEIVREVVPEKLFQEQTLDFREDVNAALLAVECLELLVVARLVAFFLHVFSLGLVLITIWRSFR
jgi:hypothetical protein